MMLEGKLFGRLKLFKIKVFSALLEEVVVCMEFESSTNLFIIVQGTKNKEGSRKNPNFDSSSRKVWFNS